MLNQNVVKKNNIKKEILTKRHSSQCILFEWILMILVGPRTQKIDFKNMQVQKQDYYIVAFLTNKVTSIDYWFTYDRTRNPRKVDKNHSFYFYF